MNLKKQAQSDDSILIKLIIYSQPDSQLTCIQLTVQIQKTLRDLGLFLYLDQKINFNDFLFADKPVYQNNLKKRTKKRLSFRSQSQEEESPTIPSYVIFDSSLTLRDVKDKLYVDQQGKTLLMMYSRKQMQAIVEGTVQQDIKKLQRDKFVQSTSYKNSTSHNECLTF